MRKLRWLWTYACFFRVLIAYVFFVNNKFCDKCIKDLEAWTDHYEFMSGHSKFWQLGYILINEKETRSIFLNRLHRNPIMFFIIRLLYCPLESLYINMPPEKIGGGLVLQHGFSTIIAAKQIGENCKVFQQVTIGYNAEYAPILDDYVTVSAGAIVIGDVFIGKGATIGAGAVVTKDVGSNMTVVGVPAREIKKKEEI